MRIEVMKKIFLIALLALPSWGQTVQQPLLVTRLYGITSAWAGECAAGVVSNVSTTSRANDYHSVYATGSGSWTVALQYGTSCSGPWTAPGGAGTITQASNPPIAFLVGYYPYVKISITGSATVTYSASKGYFLSTTASTVSYPITIGQGGTGSTTAAGALVNLGAQSAIVLNVKDFGAYGDGTHDDTTAINLAIVAAGALQYGGTIYFPEGQYLISATIPMAVTTGKSIHFKGSGMYTTALIRKATPTAFTSGDMLLIQQTAGIRGFGMQISDMGFISHGTTTSGASIHILDVTDQKVLMKNVYVQDDYVGIRAEGSGIYLSGYKYQQFTTTGAGFARPLAGMTFEATLTNGSGDNVVSDFDITGATDAAKNLQVGIYINGADGMSLTNGHIKSNLGIDFNGSSTGNTIANVFVTNVVFDAETYEGVRFTGTNLGAFFGQIYFSNCQIVSYAYNYVTEPDYTNADVGVDFYNTSATNVHFNNVAIAGWKNYGIRITAGASNIFFNGGKIGQLGITGTHAQGILIDAKVDSVGIANMSFENVSDYMDYGVYFIGAASYINVSGNTFKGMLVGPYRVAGTLTYSSLQQNTPTGTTINVRDFGATGNSSDDDTTAIQAAYTYAGTVPTGASVFFPAGKYLVSAPILIPVGVDTHGAGSNATIILVDTSFSKVGYGVLTPATGQGGVISDLAIQFPRPEKTITAATNAAATELTVTAHGLLSTYAVTIGGATGSWTPINGVHTITKTGDNTFTIPVNSTSFGALTGTPTAFNIFYSSYPAAIDLSKGVSYGRAYNVDVLNAWTAVNGKSNIGGWKFDNMHISGIYAGFDLDTATIADFVQISNIYHGPHGFETGGLGGGAETFFLENSVGFLVGNGFISVSNFSGFDYQTVKTTATGGGPTLNIVNLQCDGHNCLDMTAGYVTVTGGYNTVGAAHRTVYMKGGQLSLSNFEVVSYAQKTTIPVVEVDSGSSSILSLSGLNINLAGFDSPVIYVKSANQNLTVNETRLINTSATAAQPFLKYYGSGGQLNMNGFTAYTTSGSAKIVDLNGKTMLSSFVSNVSAPGWDPGVTLLPTMAVGTNDLNISTLPTTTAGPPTVDRLAVLGDWSGKDNLVNSDFVSIDGTDTRELAVLHKDAVTPLYTYLRGRENGTTDKFYIDSNGSAWFNGNVTAGGFLTSLYSQLTAIPLISAPAGPAAGYSFYCSDCTAGSDPCTGSGTGAVASHNGSNWVCSGPATAPSGGAVGGASALTTAKALPYVTSAGVLGEFGPNATATRKFVVQSSASAGVPILDTLAVGDLPAAAVVGGASLITVNALPYVSSAGTLNQITPNTTATRKFVVQSSASAGVPILDILASADIPDNAADTSGNAATATTAATAATLSAVLVPAKGGTGVANTATLTLGSTNVDLAALGTGIVKHTTTTGALNVADVDDLSGPTFCVSNGSTNVYACSLTPAITSYVTGTHYRFKADSVNSAAATLQLNAISGPVTLKKVVGGITTDLAAADIRNGQWVDVVYDGTNFQVQSTLGNAGGSTSIGSAYAVQTANGSGGFYDSGCTATGSAMNCPNGLIGKTLQITGQTVDPGCTLASHVGRVWLDVSSSVNTVAKQCRYVSSVLTWVTF
jgi:hypothetical protein